MALVSAKEMLQKAKAGHYAVVDKGNPVNSRRM